jgi:hypothetical protein
METKHEGADQGERGGSPRPVAVRRTRFKPSSTRWLSSPARSPLLSSGVLGDIQKMGRLSEQLLRPTRLQLDLVRQRDLGIAVDVMTQGARILDPLQEVAGAFSIADRIGRGALQQALSPLNDAIASITRLDGLFGFVGVFSTLEWWFVRADFAATLVAREALLSGDEEEVARYVRNTLGLKPTRQRLDALVLVLLDPDLEQVPVDEVGSWVRARLRDELRGHRPIQGDARPLRGQPVDSIDRSIEDGLILADTLPDPHEAMAERVVQRLAVQQALAHMLRPLDERERTIAGYRMYAESWSKAALAAGSAPAEGQAVRRRLRHLSSQPRHARYRDLQDLHEPRNRHDDERR